jgi:hypothetical protein
MERRTWTDERLDDRFDQIDRRFDQVDRRFDRLESEMREGFAGIRSEMHEGFASLGSELRSEIGALRDQFDNLRNMMFRSYVALAVALIAAIAARGI